MMQLNALQKTLGHTFKDESLLKLALTHRSAPSPHNQRLEFLGDAVLDCIIGHYLYQHYPNAPEGQLSQYRAHLVNRKALAQLADTLNLHQHLIVGPGEKNSYHPEATRADVCEAVMGAIFLDAGFNQCETCILKWYLSELNTLKDLPILPKDDKSTLQEWTQARRLDRPEYKTLNIEGPAHQQIFVVSCTLTQPDQCLQGHGQSKRAAEQTAACNMLKWLKDNGHQDE
jgi:ribonuclease III